METLADNPHDLGSDEHAEWTRRFIDAESMRRMGAGTFDHPPEFYDVLAEREGRDKPDPVVEVLGEDYCRESGYLPPKPEPFSWMPKGFTRQSTFGSGTVKPFTFGGTVTMQVPRFSVSAIHRLFFGSAQTNGYTHAYVGGGPRGIHMTWSVVDEVKHAPKPDLSPLLLPPKYQPIAKPEDVDTAVCSALLGRAVAPDANRPPLGIERIPDHFKTDRQTFQRERSNSWTRGVTTP